MEYLGELRLDQGSTFTWAIRNPANNQAADPDSNPSYRVYEEETGTPILTGTMTKLDDAGTTGFVSEKIACNAANGFQRGKSYNIYGECAVGGATITKSWNLRIEKLIPSIIGRGNAPIIILRGLLGEDGFTVPLAVALSDLNIADHPELLGAISDDEITVPGYLGIIRTREGEQELLLNPGDPGSEMSINPGASEVYRDYTFSPDNLESGDVITIIFTAIMVTRLGYEKIIHEVQNVSVIEGKTSPVFYWDIGLPRVFTLEMLPHTLSIEIPFFDLSGAQIQQSEFTNDPPGQYVIKRLRGNDSLVTIDSGDLAVDQARSNVLVAEEVLSPDDWGAGDIIIVEYSDIRITRYSKAFDFPQIREATAFLQGVGGAGGSVTVKVGEIRSDTHLSTNKIIVNTFIAGDYADVGGVVLEDSTGTYGMKEAVSGDSLIDPGTTLTKVGAGRYEITYGTLGGYDPTLDYRYAVKITNEDQVIFIDAQEIEGMEASGVNACRVKVDTVRLIGQRKAGVEVKFKIIERPQILGEEGDRTIVLKDEETALTNASGIAWIELTRLAKAKGSIPDAGYKKKFIVPDEDEADLCDIPELED